jgi:uncharacterized cupin superfamily protein
MNRLRWGCRLHALGTRSIDAAASSGGARSATIMTDATTQSDPAAAPEPPLTRAATLAAALIRNFNDAPMDHWVRGPLYESLGTSLSSGTVARKLGASVDTLPPGKRVCPYHLHHAQEEMFVVLAGQGHLRVAGELLPIRTGDVIFIPPGPEYPHHIQNTSDAPLTYLSISTQESPEICEYPDSGKFLADAHAGDTRIFGEVHKTGTGLDYWQDEP